MVERSPGGNSWSRHRVCAGNSRCRHWLAWICRSRQGLCSWDAQSHRAAGHRRPRPWRMGSGSRATVRRLLPLGPRRNHQRGSFVFASAFTAQAVRRRGAETNVKDAPPKPCGTRRPLTRPFVIRFRATAEVNDGHLATGRTLPFGFNAGRIVSRRADARKPSGPGRPTTGAVARCARGTAAPPRLSRAAAAQPGRVRS